MSRASVSSRSRSTTATSSGSGSGSGSAASSTPRIIGPYTLGGTIGAGIFAEVLLGSDEFRQQVAIKVFNKAAISKTAAGAAAGNSAASHYRSHQFLQIEKEINALRICSHPNIVQFYDVLETESKVYLVMEHLSYGELYDYILSQGRLSEAESGRLFGQVVSAIGLCHDLGVVHRDLKPENILLTENGDLKLVDFGLANYWNTKDDPAVRSLRTQCGSPHYAAPEILKGERYSGPLADAWSLGVLLYAMLCGSLPFNARSIPMLIKKIVEGKFKLPKYLSPQAQHLLQTILQVTPEHRPTIRDIQQHPWMQQYAADAPGAAGADGVKRPLSRPEIISPQSYVNARASDLARMTQTSSVFLTRDPNGGDDDDAPDEDEDDPDRPRVSGPRDAQKRSDVSPSPSLPPSSALSFQPESAFLSLLANEREEASTGANGISFSRTGPLGTSLGRPIPGATPSPAIPSELSFASSPPASAWTSATPSSRARQQAPCCSGCGRKLRPRTDADSGAFILSASLQNTFTLLPDDLCQCANGAIAATAAVKTTNATTNGSAHDFSPDTSFVPDVPRRATSALSGALADAAANGSIGSGSAARLLVQRKASPAKLSPVVAAALEARYRARADTLFRAAEAGDLASVEALITQATNDTDANEPTSPRTTAADTDANELPLPPLDVRVTTVDGWNALHYAARHGHESVVSALLTCWQPLDINCRTATGWTPLMLASHRGHAGVTNLLLRYGAAIHVTNDDGKSAIFLSREAGFAGIAQALTSASSARHLKHQTGPNAAVRDEHGEQVKELNHELFRAAECGDLAKVRHLLQLGQQQNGSGSNTSPATSTPASPTGTIGANGEPVRAHTPVPLSARRNSPKESDVAASASLPRYCVDVLARGIDNWCVLHFAARKGRTEVVRLLLAHKPQPDANARTKNMWTPLMLAADRGHTETCRVLLECGADPNSKSNDGFTALSVAREGGYSEIVSLLSKLTMISTPTGSAPDSTQPHEAIVTPR